MGQYAHDSRPRTLSLTSESPMTEALEIEGRGFGAPQYCTPGNSVLSEPEWYKALITKMADPIDSAL